MREYRLQIYRNEPDKVKPLPDINPPQDEDTDSKIGSVIILDDRNGLRDIKIDKIDSEDNSDYKNESGDYPIPKSIEE